MLVHVTALVFRISPPVTKTDFAFLWHTGKMNTGKKRFDLTREKRLPVPWRFSKEGGEACLWHTILLASSSALYLCSARHDRAELLFAWLTREE